MKALILIFVLENLIQFSATQNQIHVANLSFNIIENNNEVYRKIILKGSFTEFYIGSNMFKGATSSREEMIGEEILDIQLVDICQFISMANDIRQNKMTQTKDLGEIQVLLNHEIYDTIFIYIKEKNKIFRYKVKWIEQIE